MRIIIFLLLLSGSIYTQSTSRIGILALRKAQESKIANPLIFFNIRGFAILDSWRLSLCQKPILEDDTGVVYARYNRIEIIAKVDPADDSL